MRRLLTPVQLLCCIATCTIWLALPMSAHSATSITYTDLQQTGGVLFSPQAFSFTETAKGGTTSSTNDYLVNGQSQGNPKSTWDVIVSITGTFTNAASGATLPNSRFLVENAPLTGVYNNLSAARTVESGINKSTTTSGYFGFQFKPLAADESGVFVGTVQIQVQNGGGATYSTNITVTASITASIAASKIADAGGTAVAAVSFPETAPGSTSAPIGPYHMALTNTSGSWQVSANITTTFTYATTGATLPGTAILVKGVAQGASYVDMSSARVLQTIVPMASLNSGDFTFELSPAAGQDSGNFLGVVTITVSTL